MNPSKTLSYKELQSELQSILHALEQDGTSLDDIGQLLKSGFETVDTLKGRLTEAEAQIENIISLRHNTQQKTLLPKGEGESE
ncbi:MAG: exodeoxyribonuclease VII small subunit [Betaproteobacteria bacterium]|nr:exodeoxyribonuclease VII small subunit [Betaproteobacteria bacterium]